MKVIFLPKNDFSFAFLYPYLSYVTLFIIIKLHRLDLRNFIQVWWATLKVWNGGPESYSSVHAKKPSIYGDDFLSHGMSVLSQYFHLVSTKCKMNKILDIFIYLKHNKTNLRTPFKSQNGKKYLHVNLIDYILTPSWVPS